MFENLYVFTDESCTNSAKFMMLGGLAVKESNLQTVRDQIASIRTEYGSGELKWSKVANQKYDHYKRFVDVILDAIDDKMMSYHSAIFDNHRINHKLYSGGNERGFFTLYKQFLAHQVGNGT